MSTEKADDFYFDLNWAWVTGHCGFQKNSDVSDLMEFKEQSTYLVELQFQLNWAGGTKISIKFSGIVWNCDVLENVTTFAGYCLIVMEFFI